MRMGIDLGGTKVEAVILDDDGSIIWRQRQPTPRHDYDAIISTISGLITAASADTAFPALSVWASRQSAPRNRTGARGQYTGAQQP